MPKKNERKSIACGMKEGELIPYKSFIKRYTKKEREDIAERVRYLQVAAEIRKLRKKLGLSQGLLAQKMKVKREFISRMESGTQNVTLDTLYRVGEATGREVAISFRT